MFRGHIAVGVILFGSVSLGLVFGIATPVLPSLAMHFGGGQSGTLLAQMTFTVSCIGLMLGGPLAGYGMQRWGERPVLLGALLLFALSGSAGMYLDSFAGFVVARMLLGLAAASVNAVGVTLLSRRFLAENRSRMIGYYNACGPIASVVVLMLAGLVSEYIGWRAPFSFYLLGVLVWCGALFAISGAPLESKATEATVSIGPPLWPHYLLLVALSVPVFTVSIQVPFLLAELGSARPALVATVAAVCSVAVALGALSFGLVRAILDERGTLALIAALMAAGHCIMGAVEHVVCVALGGIVSQLGAGLLVPHFLSLLMDRLPPAVHGRIPGRVFSCHFLGIFLSPILVSPLSMRLGVQQALLVMAAVLMAAVLVIMLRSGKSTG